MVTGTITTTPTDQDIQANSKEQALIIPKEPTKQRKKAQQEQKQPDKGSKHSISLEKGQKEHTELLPKAREQHANPIPKAKKEKQKKKKDGRVIRKESIKQ